MRTLAAAAALALLLLPGAQAFTSVPPGTSVHDDITAVAKDAGWAADAVEALQQAVREVDYDEAELDPKGTDLARIDGDSDYHATHHCDRGAGADDAGAFDGALNYIQEQRANATARAKAGDPDGAVAALGRALHALQDCYSHSNIVDLPDQQRAFEDAVLHGGSAAAFVGLRLCGYQPGADEPDDPPGDPYPHKRFAKDDADGNAESRLPAANATGNETKFDSAKSLARLATVAFLQEFTQGLSSSERAAVMRVSEERGGLPDKVNVPGPLWPAAAAVAIAVLSLRVRDD